jgi:hypothetical protein
VLGTGYVTAFWPDILDGIFPGCKPPARLLIEHSFGDGDALFYNKPLILSRPLIDKPIISEAVMAGARSVALATEIILF